MTDVKASGRGASLTKSTAPAGGVDHGADGRFEAVPDLAKDLVSRPEIAGNGRSAEL
jgi:hypothetical protein